MQKNRTALLNECQSAHMCNHFLQHVGPGASAGGPEQKHAGREGMPIGPPCL